MQEWVDTLRLKLREMKILSPKENLYSKLPEIRPPLLPTRDPTRDPLPATPPVPAAIVPGVERIVNTTQTSRTPAVPVATLASSTSMHVTTGNPSTEPATSNAEGNERSQNRRTTPPARNTTEIESDAINDDSFVVETPNATTSAPLSSTSNTLSQNLIKMLYPLPNFSHPANDSSILPNEGSGSGSDESFVSDSQTLENMSEPKSDENTDESVHSLARTFAANVLFDANTSSSSKRSQNVASSSSGLQSSGALSNNRTNDTTAEDTISVDSSVYGIYPTPEPIVIPR